MSNRTQVYMDVRCMVMEQRAMIQIFMVFPSKVGAPGHVSGMCSSLWTTWARKKVPEVNICIWEVQFGGCGGTGGPTAVRTSFAIVLICLTSRRSPAEESETPPSVVERCLCPQVDDSEPQLWPRAGLGSGLKDDSWQGSMYQTGEPGEQVCRRALRKLRRRHMLRRPR